MDDYPYSTLLQFFSGEFNGTYPLPEAEPRDTFLDQSEYGVRIARTLPTTARTLPTTARALPTTVVCLPTTARALPTTVRVLPTTARALPNTVVSYLLTCLLRHLWLILLYR